MDEVDVGALEVVPRSIGESGDVFEVTVVDVSGDKIVVMGFVVDLL